MRPSIEDCSTGKINGGGISAFSQPFIKRKQSVRNGSCSSYQDNDILYSYCIEHINNYLIIFIIILKIFC